MTTTRVRRCYTAAEIAEMHELADEARELAARGAALLVRAQYVIERDSHGDDFWMLSTQYYPSLAALADLLPEAPTPTADWKLNPDRIREGWLIEAGENPRSWAKRNRAVGRWLKKLENAVSEAER